MSSSHLKFVISMDFDDLTMNNQSMTDYLGSKNSERIELVYFFGQSNGKIDAINRDIPLEGWDIIVATADDMEPFQDWDKTMIENFKENFFKAINYNTDPRVKDFKTLITLPVIGKDLYKHFGYIYHKSYRSEFADNEQTMEFEKMGILEHVDRQPIIHKWHENQDALMGKNIYEGSFDRAVFERRKSEGFPR